MGLVGGGQLAFSGEYYIRRCSRVFRHQKRKKKSTGVFSTKQNANGILSPSLGEKEELVKEEGQRGRRRERKYWW